MGVRLFACKKQPEVRGLTCFGLCDGSSPHYAINGLSHKFIIFEWLKCVSAVKKSFFLPIFILFDIQKL
jgi:hypothetical protein